MAPFYDLVCTRAIERIDARLALSVGGEFVPGNIRQGHWDKLAGECGVRKQYLQKLIRTQAEALLEHVRLVQEAFEITHGAYPALQRVHQVITKQCRNALR